MKTTKKTSWGDITIDTKRGTITLLQRWQYVAWELGSRAPKFNPTPWTEAEKANFHKIAVSQILAAWTPNVRFKPTGKNPFLKKFANTGFKFEIDIRRVHANPHWKVTVRKLPPISKFRSNVDWGAKKLTITANTQPVTHKRPQRRDQFGHTIPPVVTQQLTAPHEFGHMMGPTLDEYNRGDGAYPDAKSIMNIGSEIRRRHFFHLDKVLDEMVFLTDFDVEINKSAL